MAGITRATAPYHLAVATFRRQLVEKTLREHDGNRSRTAAALGLQRTYLCRLIRVHRIDVPAEHERVTYMPPRSAR